MKELDNLRMENAYLKKLNALIQTTAQKAQIVIELRHQYTLAGLLKLADLARSTFYYQQKALQVADKYADLKARIKTIFDRHKGR
jgi:putative transposase